VIISSPLVTTTAEAVTKLSMPKLLVIGTQPDAAHEDVTGSMRVVHKLLPAPKQIELIPEQGAALLTSGIDFRDLLVNFLESLN
jgi:hypothetical protein